MKRIISAILTLSMLAAVLTVAPLTSSAADISADTQTTQELSVTGDGTVANILSDEIENIQEDETDCADCITGVTVEGRTAAITFNNATPCMIVAGIYDDAGETLLMTAQQRDIEPDTGEITLEFDDDLPEYFYLRVFILDSNCAPLHKQYESERYTQAYQDFLSKTTEDFPAEDVLNLDGDHTNNFAVYSDNVNTIDTSAHNTLRSQSGSRYTFSDIDASLSQLQAGDIFTFDNNGETEIIKVGAITVTDDTAVIESDESLKLEDAFDFVKIDTSAVSGAAEIDMSGADDGVSLDDSGLAPTGAEIETENKKEFKFRFDYGVASGGLTLTAGYHLTFYYDHKLIDAEFSVDTEVKLDFTLSKEIKINKQLGKAAIPTPIAGVAVGIGFSLILEASAEISASATLTSSVGFSYNEKSGFDLISQKPKIVAEVGVEGKFFAGVGLTPSVYVLYGLAELKLPVQIGGEITAKAALTTTDTDEAAHKCGHCIDGKVSVLLKVSGALDVMVMWEKKIDFGEFRYELFEFYCSSELGWGKGKCPNRENPDILDVATFNTYHSSDYGTCSIDYTLGSNVMTISGSGILGTDYCGNAYVALILYMGDNDPDRFNEDWYYTSSIRKYFGMIDTIYINGFTEIDDLPPPASYYGNPIPVDVHITGPTVAINGFGMAFRPKSITMPDTVRIIGGGYLPGSTGSSGKFSTMMSSIQLPSSLEYIGKGAFAGTSIQHLTIPSSVKYIGDYAFSGVPIQHLTIPSSVTYIGDHAFDSARFEQITVPESVTYTAGIFESGPFDGSAVRSATIESEAPNLFCGCKTLKTVSFGDNVAKIGDRTFANCTSLTGITIPPSVTDIGDSAFAGSGLTDITIPGTVKKIGAHAFDGCKNLRSVTIEEGVKQIDEAAFINCPVLERVTLPASLRELGDKMFINCPYLKTICYRGSVKEWQEIIVGHAYTGNTYQGNTYDITAEEAQYYLTLRDSIYGDQIEKYNFSQPLHDHLLKINDWKDDYNYVEYAYFLDCNYLEKYGYSLFTDLYANQVALNSIQYHPWLYDPENYREYRMKDFDAYWAATDYTAHGYRPFVYHTTVYCTGGNRVEQYAPAPTGGLAATGAAPEENYQNAEYLIAVEDADDGRLQGGISYLKQVKADENGELTYLLPEGSPGDGEYLNIYGACRHPSAHFDDDGGYVCADCGKALPRVFEASAPDYDPEQPTEPIAGILGDADDDGEVSITDATYIQRYEVGIPLPNPINLVNADVDGDGYVDVYDATLIQRYNVGIIDKFPAEK